MLVCPFCEAELTDEDKREGGWDCACGEHVPEALAVDTDRSRCGCNRCI